MDGLLKCLDAWLVGWLVSRIVDCIVCPLVGRSVRVRIRVSFIGCLLGIWVVDSWVCWLVE